MTRATTTRRINVYDPSAYPLWRQGMTPWTWYEIPNTALSSVAPSPTPPGISGPSSKIVAWCGATLRRLNSIYMLGAAGGHGDYHGNEVNQLDLSQDAPAWIEARAPTATEDVVKSTQVYLDLRRSSTHTYWTTQYDQANDRMLIMNSDGPDGVPPPPDAPTDWPWRTGKHPQGEQGAPLMAYDFALADWLHPDALSPLPAYMWPADLCCPNPATGEIFCVATGDGKMRKYAPATDTWSIVGSWVLNGSQAGSAIDPTRGVLLYVGDYAAVRDPGMRSIADASDASPTFTGLAVSTLHDGAFPGVVYDEENDNFLVFRNGSPIEVYRVSHVSGSTWNIDAPTIGGTKPALRPQGVHNSVQYVPELKGCVIANSYTGNVKFLPVA